MTGDEHQTDSIQLHFCQRCGISIPDADIDTGRAKAAPGGYVCVGCIYQARDDQITPKPTGVRNVSAASNSSGGTHALAVVAILYLVGVTTFLLVKELNRKPPEIVLPPVATAQDITVLSRKVDNIDNQSRKALSQLQSNDNVQREDLSKLSGGLNRIQRRVDDHVALVKTQHKDVIDSLTEVSERTIGLDRAAKDILRQISGLERGSGDEPGEPTPPPKEKTTGTKPVKPPTEVVDPARKKQVEKLIQQMLNKRVDKQERFNAAVQLGDLQDPSSVEALVTALKKDSYDLVRRAAAYSLGMLGKHSVKAVPDLIAQMDDKQPYVGYMCERALGDITKAVLGATVTYHFDPIMSLKERRAIKNKWEAWYEKNKENLK